MKTTNLLSGMCLAVALVITGCGDDSGTMAGGAGGNGGMGGAAGAGGTGGAPRMGQLDRMGRPAINTALTQTFTDVDKEARKDEYNAADPSSWSSFAADFAPNLAILDSLDAVCGNQLLAGDDGSRYDLLAGFLADDQIYVDSRQGESTCGYLGVEAAALLGGGPSCGGRLLADDVMDVTYSLLAVGPFDGPPPVGDAVPNTSTFSLEFPFLGAPN